MKWLVVENVTRVPIFVEKGRTETFAGSLYSAVDMHLKSSEVEAELQYMHFRRAMHDIFNGQGFVATTYESLMKM